MKLTTIKITELSLDPSNVRKHGRKNLDAIKASLRKFGQQKPIVVDAKGIVLAGNGTLAAAQELGWTEIMVTRTELTGSAATAFAIADNRTAELAEWDEDGLAKVLESLKVEDADLFAATGYDLAEVDKMIGSEVTEDEVPEPPADPITKPGDLWLLHEHRLLCGDSTDAGAIERLLDGAQPDMVFADPPYGISHSGKGITANGVKGNDFGEILGDGDVSVAVDSLSYSLGFFQDATLIYWGANYYSASVPNGFGWLVWDKQREGDTFSGAELAFVNKGVRLDVFRHMWHGMVKASEHGQARVHPTQKPVALSEWCFAHYGEPKVIFDPFSGSGSTLLAAEKTKRTYYGVEMEPKYCDVIVKRWENLTGKKAVLENRTP